MRKLLEELFARYYPNESEDPKAWRRREGQLEVERFLYEDIYAEGLADRVRAAMEGMGQ